MRGTGYRRLTGVSHCFIDFPGARNWDLRTWAASSNLGLQFVAICRHLGTDKQARLNFCPGSQHCGSPGWTWGLLGVPGPPAGTSRELEQLDSAHRRFRLAHHLYGLSFPGVLLASLNFGWVPVSGTAPTFKLRHSHSRLSMYTPQSGFEIWIRLTRLVPLQSLLLTSLHTRGCALGFMGLPRASVAPEPPIQHTAALDPSSH